MSWYNRQMVNYWLQDLNWRTEPSAGVAAVVQCRDVNKRHALLSLTGTNNNLIEAHTRIKLSQLIPLGKMAVK
jgi:hypothetical protein